MAPSTQSQSGEWVFITTSPAHRRPTKAQRSQMRQRVMREIGYARRKEHSKVSQSEASCVPTDASSTVLVRGPSAIESQPGSLNPPVPTVPAPGSILSSVAWPVPLNTESQWLLQHMFSDTTSNKFRIYRDRWYPLCMTHTAAFDQMLVTYATHVSHDWPEHKLQHFIFANHARALARVRNHLGSQPAREPQAFYGILSAIAALACYSHLIDDRPSWGLHMMATSRLIKESGLKPTELDGRVIDLAQWVDSIGSYAFDTAPVLGYLKTDDSHYNSAEPLPPCLRNLDLSVPLCLAVRALQRVNAQLSLRAFTIGTSIWRNPTEIDRLIYPLTYQLLSIRQNTGDIPPIYSCIRSAALLYLAEFRRKSGISPVLTCVHLRRLCNALNAIDQASIKTELTLWLLTVGAMEAKHRADQRYFHTRLSQVLRALGIDSVLLWKLHLEAIVWFDCLFDMKLNMIWKVAQTHTGVNQP
ncbi:hypothetical protein BDW71DRAFT_181003 [Aspergillus fruticulosus]